LRIKVGVCSRLILELFRTYFLELPGLFEKDSKKANKKPVKVYFL